MPKRSPEEELAVRTRRGFLALGAGAVVGIAGWEWLRNGTDEGGIPAGFRRVQAFNERVTRGALYGDDHLAPVFPVSSAGAPKPNGEEGLDDDVEDADWQVDLTRLGETQAGRKIELADIQKLPKVEHVTEFKCIEGWSTVVHWGGARLKDFTTAFAPGSEQAKYVGMETPNRGYYAGVDTASALHPQTLLAYEMNGEPLTDEHGAPLRLVIPVKYGIKNLKRIGRITYTDKRPADYWAERGYDYYAGL